MSAGSGNAAAALKPGGNRERGLRIASIGVRTKAADVAQFAEATGTAPFAGFVPLTYPFCWLALPEARRLIMDLVGSDALPVHESQSFTYLRALQPDCDYSLSIEAFRGANSDRVTLQAAVSTLDGKECLNFETVLRIVPLCAERRA
jgi:hypothetical protein